MNEVLNLAPVALLTFGGVWVVNFFFGKYTKIVLDTQSKIILSIVLAFIFAFIPIEFQNEFANRVRDAIAVTVGITAIFQGGKAIKAA